MPPPSRSSRGYSLVELLTVLAIVGILAMVGVAMIGDRSASSVRSVMDDLEGAIAGAHKFTASSGTDVLIATRGDWAAANPLILAYGSANITTTTAEILTNGANRSESFRVDVRGTGLAADHQRAGIVTQANAAWWGSAATGSQDLSSVPPFSDSSSGFAPVLASGANNLFQGGTTANALRISGANKRFTSTFYIQVVSLHNGMPVTGGPMGLLVGLANGATIYKFYNPGVLSGGTGAWRKL